MVKEIKAFLTSDGSIFVNELEAYKHECKYLQNIADNNKVTSNNSLKNIKEYVTSNGITIEYIKEYDIQLLKTHMYHPPHISGIYMWFNTKEKKGYVGSAEDLFRRCSDFLRVETKYANETIDKLRKNNINDFAYLILEENTLAEKLIDSENYYIGKYDTIKNGYNTRLAIANPFRTGKTYTEEEKLEKARIKSAEQTFNTLSGYIKEWGMKIGETFTIQKWIENYDVKKDSFSFRIPCFMKNKDVVEFDDLVRLGNVIKMLVDKPHYGYRTETDAFPTTMIRFRQVDKKYLAVGNDSRTFENPLSALEYHVEEKFRIKTLGYLDRCKEDIKNEIIDFFKKISIEELIKLRYKDSSKILNYINSQRKKEENAELEYAIASAE
jgi:group I intron endonuclease